MKKIALLLTAFFMLATAAFSFASPGKPEGKSPPGIHNFIEKAFANVTTDLKTAFIDVGIGVPVTQIVTTDDHVKQLANTPNTELPDLSPDVSIIRYNSHYQRSLSKGVKATIRPPNRPLNE